MIKLAILYQCGVNYNYHKTLMYTYQWASAKDSHKQLGNSC